MVSPDDAQIVESLVDSDPAGARQARENEAVAAAHLERGPVSLPAKAAHGFDHDLAARLEPEMAGAYRREGPVDTGRKSGSRRHPPGPASPLCAQSW